MEKSRPRDTLRLLPDLTRRGGGIWGGSLTPNICCCPRRRDNPHVVGMNNGSSKGQGGSAEDGVLERLNRRPPPPGPPDTPPGDLRPHLASAVRVLCERVTASGPSATGPRRPHLHQNPEINHQAGPPGYREAGHAICPVRASPGQRAPSCQSRHLKEYLVLRERQPLCTGHA